MNTRNKNEKGCVIWFTGLPQSGKTTIANIVTDKLRRDGYSVEHLDGDITRKHLTSDLGFSKKDRDENIRRVGFVTEILERNGIIVIASFVSPYYIARKNVRDKAINFIEVFCNAPLSVCESRDTKGMYKKARNGEIEFFTGVSDPYEIPKNPEIELLTDKEKVEECVERVLRFVKENAL
jgi:adenylyl-sulfate kinase